MSQNPTRRCPACERLFDRDETYCPFDASPLEAWVPDDPLVGKLVAGRYRLLRPLGAGGMGVVYAAEQAPMGRKVAVKLLKDERAGDPKAVERFKQEARMISALKSPHTVTLFEFGQDDDGSLFLAMELLEGQTLRELLGKRGRLTIEEMAPILDQVARGLSEAHARGLVHRDIKPDNIFLSRSADYTQFVKVLDFGVAATLEAGSAPGLTRSGELPGTPGYLAPERILGEPFDARADVYALGVTMYQALTGRLPFRNSGNWDVLVHHLNADPMPLEEAAPGLVLPDALLGLLWRCMAKHPGSRPADADAFRTELLRALQVSDQASWSYDTGLVPPALLPTTDAQPAVEPPPRPRASSRWRVAGAAAATLFALATGYLLGQATPGVTPATGGDRGTPVTASERREPAAKPRSAEPGGKPRTAEPDGRPRTADEPDEPVEAAAEPSEAAPLEPVGAPLSADEVLEPSDQAREGPSATVQPGPSAREAPRATARPRKGPGRPAKARKTGPKEPRTAESEPPAAPEGSDPVKGDDENFIRTVVRPK